MADKKVPVKLEENDLTKILIAVFVIVITLVLFALYRRAKNARRAILLTGLCDSGKTLIFSHLIHKRFVNTQTSIKENIGDYIVKNSSLRIIDVPGHERLRYKFFDQYKAIARGIVFVVDSVSLQKDIRDAAEYLYNILTDSTVVNNSSSVLILCNKQDLSLAKGSNAVKSMLEKELNTLRLTKSRQLDSVDSKNNKVISLGKDSKDFDFSLLHPIKVDFVECYAFSKDKGSSVDLEQLNKWLVKIA